MSRARTYTADELGRVNSTVLVMLAQRSFESLGGSQSDFDNVRRALTLLGRRVSEYNRITAALGCRCLSCPNRAAVQAPEAPLAPMVTPAAESRQLTI